MVTFPRTALDELILALERRGFRVIGPTVRDGAVMLGTIHVSDELPVGRTDTQSPGTYRLTERNDKALFGHAVGPDSWKRFLYPPVQTLLTSHRERTTRSSGTPGFTQDLHADGSEETRMALFGIRPCDLAALTRLDTVLLGGAYQDPQYAHRRLGAFAVVAHCTQPGGTCFCASMGTGPKAVSGFDIALTEVIDGDRQYFVATSASERGASVLHDVHSTPSTPREIQAANQAVEDATARMGRTLEVRGLRELFQQNFDHPRWHQTAQRCLACGNCTMVCPTCFCSTMEDVTDLTGSTAERRRRWDSCFTLDHSYIHGGSVRPSGMARYRQWITHKLSTWVDHFGTAGCTGCGRCITWCPVGIDITQEAAALRQPTTDPVTRQRESVDGRSETRPAEPSVL
jgi:ferredoxin